MWPCLFSAQAKITYFLCSRGRRDNSAHLCQLDLYCGFMDNSINTVHSFFYSLWAVTEELYKICTPWNQVISLLIEPILCCTRAKKKRGQQEQQYKQCCKYFMHWYNNNDKSKWKTQMEAEHLEWLLCSPLHSKAVNWDSDIIISPLHWPLLTLLPSSQVGLHWSLKPQWVKVKSDVYYI